MRHWYGLYVLLCSCSIQYVYRIYNLFPINFVSYQWYKRFYDAKWPRVVVGGGGCGGGAVYVLKHQVILSTSTVDIVYTIHSTQAVESHTQCLSYVASVLGIYLLSGQTSYRMISWCLEVAIFGFRLFQSLWHFIDASAADLPRCLSNFTGIRSLWHPVSWLRNFTSSYGKTLICLVNRDPGSDKWIMEKSMEYVSAW